MIKIAFTDWWNGFNKERNFITKTLDSKIEYIIQNDDPSDVDFVFCSVFGERFLEYKCPRVLYTGENCIPDFNLYDYGIGFENMLFGDRYYRFPLYIVQYYDYTSESINKRRIANAACERDFCSMVVSNSMYADDYRDKLFEKLSEYKMVSSGGRYKNNIGLPEGVEDKISFLNQYKFNISCENVSHNGYCTEKIMDAFYAGTVPIYWGDPDAVKYFNPKAFINCHDYNSIQDVVDHIKEVNENDDLYREILNQPVFSDTKYNIENMVDRFSEWLVPIVSQKKDEAYRRSLNGWSFINEEKTINRIKLNHQYEDLMNNKTIIGRVKKRIIRDSFR